MKSFHPRARSAAALVIFLSTTGFVHECSGGGAPTPLGCEDPVGSGSFELALGTESAEGAFVPLADGDALRVVRGGQGALMFPVRVDIAASGGPGCVSTRVEVRDVEGVSLDVFEGNLLTTAEGDRLTTEPIYFVMGEWPPEVVLLATVGGTEVSLRAVLPMEPTPGG